MSYEYNICHEYNRKEFKSFVEVLKIKVKNIIKIKYIEDPLDGDQLQILIIDEGKIVVKNDFMVGAVWVESDIELEL